MSGSTLTLTDIAALAGVQRPVVSMWRKRRTVHGRVCPFPGAVATVGGVERFDLDEVRDYLSSTHRGRNKEAGIDAPALAVPESSTLDDLVTLLTLRHLADDDLVGEDLAAVARGLDVDDNFLVREVESIEKPPLAYIDELYAASFGASDAFDRLTRTRAGRQDRREELTTRAVELLAPVVEALLRHLGEDADLVDASAGASTAVAQLAAAAGHPLLIEGEGAAARAARRVATLRGARLDKRSGLRALRVDTVTGLDPVEALDRADLLVKELGPADIGLVIGPAAVLTDRIADKVREADRDDQLRGGYVRAAVRLPRAMHRAAPRQAQALWLVTSESSDQPVAVADLGDSSPGQLDGHDLAMDLVAVTARQRGHHFSYLVPRRIAEVVTGPTVVARGVRAREAARPGNAGGRLRELVGVLGGPLPGIEVAVSGDSEAEAEAVTVTLAELRRRSELRIRRGSRLDLSWADPNGSVGTAAVIGWEDVRFDPLTLEAEAPRASRTEPGDVVFTTNPMRAHVDEVGGRVVPTPARVIRLEPSAPLGPHALAAQINALPATARDPDAWRLMVSPDPETEQRLSDLDAVRRDLQQRLDSVDELTRLVADGAAPGLTVITTPLTADREH